MEFFQIEEMILESLVWRTGSPLWAAIENHSLPIPKCEDVLLPTQIMDEQELKAAQITSLNPVIQKVSHPSKFSTGFLVKY